MCAIFSLPLLQSLCADGNTIISSKINNSDQPKERSKNQILKPKTKKDWGNRECLPKTNFLKKTNPWSTPCTVICPILYPRGFLINPCGCVFCRGKNFHVTRVLPPRRTRCQSLLGFSRASKADVRRRDFYQLHGGARGRWLGRGRGRKALLQGLVGVVVFFEKSLGVEVGCCDFLAWSVRCMWLLKSWGFNVGSGFIGRSECFLCLIDPIGPQIKCTKI